MKKRNLSFILIVILTLLASLTLRCNLSETDEGDDDDDAGDTELSEAMEEAKELLSQGLYADAKNAFNAILVDLDAEYSPAKFGWALSRTFELLYDLANEMITLLTSIDDFADLFRNSEVTGDSSALVRSFQPQQGTGILGTLVNGVLDLLDRSLEQIDEMLEAAIADDDFIFTIDAMPVKIEVFEVMDAGGEYDHSDALLFSGIAKFLRGVIALLYAYNYDVDLINAMPSIYLLLENDSIVATTGNVINFAAYLVNTNPALLNLDSDGAQMLEQARELMAAGANRTVDAIESAMAETDDQQDDILAVDQAAVPPMVIANVELSNELLDHSTYSDGRMMIANLAELQAATARFSDNLISGGPRLTWADDLAPVIGFLVVIILDSGLLGVVTDYVVSEVDSDFADYIFGSTEDDETSETDVIDFLNNWIPDYLELDVGGFFDYKGNLRDILPPTRIPDDIDENPERVFSSGFLHEWECDAALAYSSSSSLMPGLLCPDGDEYLTDIGHFPPTEEYYAAEHYYPGDTTVHNSLISEFDVVSIPADGLKSPLPYFPLKDPTFNHLVWVNIDEITPRVAHDENYSGFMMADLYSVSKAFANVSDNFIALILYEDLDDVMNKEKW